MKTYHLTLDISIAEIPDLPAATDLAVEDTPLDPVRRDEEEFKPEAMIKRMFRAAKEMGVPAFAAPAKPPAIPAQARTHECYEFAANDIEEAVRVFRRFAEIAANIGTRTGAESPRQPFYVGG